MANKKSALALHEVLTSQVLQRRRFDRMTSTISTDITSSGHLQYIPNIMDSCYTSKQFNTINICCAYAYYVESKVILLQSFPAFDKRNPLCTYEKDIPELQNFHIGLKCDPGLDQRVYNLPTSSEIAAIWVEDNDNNITHAPHIQIYTHSNITQIVNYYYGFIKHTKSLLSRFISSNRSSSFRKRKEKRDTVFAREYYCYRPQMRNDDKDELLHTSRLFQQYSVDEYIKIETQRLDFASFNQDLFRMDILQGLLDILRLGKRDSSNIDLFITMTCNPTWPEIKEHLWTTDEEQNRPDLISRVFRAKVEELKTDISKRNNFGKVVAYMYTAYDGIISAELPDRGVHGSAKVVKYLYKYIYKGHDKIAFYVHDNESHKEIDEIKEYQSARWVSPPKATWHLFSFSISEMYPSVYHLQLHLKGKQFVSFKGNTDTNTIINYPMINKTMLTEFFQMNRTNKDSIKLNLLYKEFPEYFVWSTTDKTWTWRQQRCTVGRIVTCHPTEGERYYLRLILLNVRGPKSYKDLRTINGEHYNTFRESAKKKGLLHCDNSLIDCMSEAAGYQMPYSLRHLFATLLVYCNPVNPKEIWK
ncbi:uncharacterized protein LOC142182019 [Nicotiana tabacum]|uniref:Uncharacterized protein LOC142182019 n=1 Tax=Nicotiana tabacum TaxID=4097 RepID=A0AC58UQY8_TOBAC